MKDPKIGLTFDQQFLYITVSSDQDIKIKMTPKFKQNQLRVSKKLAEIAGSGPTSPTSAGATEEAKPQGDEVDMDFF